MTPTSILTELRSTLNDSDTTPANQRWLDATLRGYMYSGEIEIVESHPESQYITKVANSTPALLTDNGSSFTIADSYRVALIHYVAFRCFGEDSEDANNMKLSASHYTQYLEALK